MNILFISLAAIGLYLLAASQFAFSILRPGGEIPVARQRLIGIGMLALVLHALVLYHGIVTPDGINLGFFNAASLVAWVIALLLLLAVLTKPLENLAIVLLPLAAITVGLEYLMPSDRIFPLTTPVGLQIHILLSVVAYSILSVAALQAIVLAIQDHQLHTKRPGMILRALPPLQVMESLMFQLIGLGFFLLSLSLVSGIVFLENMFAQHLAHKTVLSILAWGIFMTLLWGRWRFGWRGKTAIRWTIGGFIALMLAYFGSKLVLELILGR